MPMDLWFHNRLNFIFCNLNYPIAKTVWISPITASVRRIRQSFRQFICKSFPYRNAASFAAFSEYSHPPVSVLEKALFFQSNDGVDELLIVDKFGIDAAHLVNGNFCDVA